MSTIKTSDKITRTSSSHLSSHISFFCGGGGSAIGAKKAGYNLIAAIDNSQVCLETVSSNFPKADAINIDINKLKPEWLLERLAIKKGSIGLIDFSSPHKVFSRLKNEKIKSDYMKMKLLYKIPFFISELFPQSFVIEIDSILTDYTYFYRIFQFRYALSQLGYIFTQFYLSVEHHGVPQCKGRSFIVGIRKDLDKWPVIPRPFLKIINLKDIIPTAIDYHFNQNQSIWALTGESAYCIKKQKIFLITYEDGRIDYPTIDELKKIYSFPKNYKLSGSKNEKWGMIVNAIPPMMMYHLIKKSILY